jgi:hypothetical protein
MSTCKRYVGPIPHLRGKRAFVQPREESPEKVMARFEELNLKEALGRWEFAATDFDSAGEPPTDRVPAA